MESVSCVWTDNFAFLLATSEKDGSSDRQASRETHVRLRAPSARLLALPSRTGERARSTAAVRSRCDSYATRIPFVRIRRTID